MTIRPGVTLARASLRLLAKLPVSTCVVTDMQTGGRKARGYVLLWQFVPANLQILLVVYRR